MAPIGQYTAFSVRSSITQAADATTTNLLFRAVYCIVCVIVPKLGRQRSQHQTTPPGQYTALYVRSSLTLQAKATTFNDLFRVVYCTVYVVVPKPRRQRSQCPMTPVGQYTAYSVRIIIYQPASKDRNIQ